MMTEPTDKAAAVLAFTRELRNDALEREAIQNEPIDRARANGKAARPPAEFPRNVWTGTLRELRAMNLPEAASIGALGDIPMTAGERILIHGAPSTCKTLLAYHGAIGHVLGGGTVMLVQGEGRKRATVDRLCKLAAGINRAGLGDAEERVHIVHGAFDLLQDHRAFVETFERVKPSMVVVDPLVSYSRAKENDAAEMSGFLRGFDFVIDAGATLVVLHHATKPDQHGRTRERGSGAIRAWADSSIGLSVKPGDPPGNVQCEHDKCRDEEKQPRRLLRWLFTASDICLDSEELDAPEPMQQANAPKPSRDSRNAAILAKRTGQLVALLGKTGGLTRHEIRDRVGWSGGELKAVLDPLFGDSRVHQTREEGRNARGQSRVREIIRLGAAGVTGSDREESERVADSRSGATPGHHPVSDGEVVTDE
jgi:hypothetical protein